MIHNIYFAATSVTEVVLVSRERVSISVTLSVDGLQMSKMPDNSSALQTLLSHKTSRRNKKGSIPVQESPMQSMMSNPLFASMFGSLMQEMNTVTDNAGDVDELKEQIVQKVLSKLGIESSRLETLCRSGKGMNIIASIDGLEDTKTHDFLIVHTYPAGNLGYITFKGNYEDAKRHALSCLAKEHGMYDHLPDEKQYCIRRYPIYTLETESVRIEVIPHASWISLDPSTH
jgi:hypothetical protein